MTTSYVVAPTSPTVWAREDSANAYAHASKSRGTQTEGSSAASWVSLFTSIDGPGGLAESSTGATADDSRKSDRGRCGSAQTGQDVDGCKMQEKPATNAKKLTRIAIERGNLSRLYHAWRRSVNDPDEAQPWR